MPYLVILDNAMQKTFIKHSQRQNGQKAFGQLLHERDLLEIASLLIFSYLVMVFSAAVNFSNLGNGIFFREMHWHTSHEEEHFFRCSQVVFA